MPRQRPASRAGTRRSARLRGIAAENSVEMASGPASTRKSETPTRKKIARGKTSLLDLPVELVLKIIEFACKTPTDFAKVALLSKRFAGLVCAMPKFRDLSEPVKRRALLAAKLNSVGLKLRADSQLCEDYINHGSRSLREIVPIMLEMRWYFACTTYSSDRVITEDDGYSDDDYGGYSDDDDFGYGYGGYRRNYYRGPRTYVDSEYGKQRANEKWAAKQLRRGYFVCSADFEPANEQPPESLRAELDRLIAGQLKSRIGGARGDIAATSLKDIYKALDAKFPGILGTKISKLAKKLLGDDEVKRLIAVK